MVVSRRAGWPAGWCGIRDQHHGAGSLIFGLKGSANPGQRPRNKQDPDVRQVESSPNSTPGNQEAETGRVCLHELVPAPTTRAARCGAVTPPSFISCSQYRQYKDRPGRRRPTCPLVQHPSFKPGQTRPGDLHWDKANRKAAVPTATASPSSLTPSGSSTLGVQTLASPSRCGTEPRKTSKKTASKSSVSAANGAEGISELVVARVLIESAPLLFPTRSRLRSPGCFCAPQFPRCKFLLFGTILASHRLCPSHSILPLAAADVEAAGRSSNSRWCRLQFMQLRAVAVPKCGGV